MKKPTISRSSLTGIEKVQGERLEAKIKRLVTSGEPISDGAPEIFTERKDGVKPEYNIRTDRWEIAADAMHLVHTSQKEAPSNIAERQHKPLEPGSGETPKEGGEVAEG